MMVKKPVTSIRISGGVWPAIVSDPAAAWPVPQRKAMPGPVGFYATLAVLLAAVASVVLLVVRHRARRAAEREAGARWARPRGPG